MNSYKNYKYAKRITPCPEEIETIDGSYLGKFAHVFLTHGGQSPLDTKMADNSSPGSVGLSRGRANKIPDQGSQLRGLTLRGALRIHFQRIVIKIKIYF